MPPRLRPTRIELVVDGLRLRAQLTAGALAAVGDEARQRRGALDLLRGALFRGRMIAKERLEEGAGGVQTARLLAAVADEVISALYDFTTVHIFRARNPTAGERLAVLAVGGYGRGALAPFSDIDLLFLRPYKPTAHQESVIEFMLYALWDLGFKVGHASRTIDECVRLSREDLTIRTALLEGRLLVGDAALADDLRRRFRREVVQGTGAEFVAAKLKERDDRHTRAGAARYVVEPNVKEGKGGLRDLNTLFWIAQYLHPSDTPVEFVRLESFTKREIKSFLRAFDFLWAVRCHLHFATGRPEERLSFDLQPEIAARMGYGVRSGREDGDTVAVERFMRRYFLIAREVGVLTRIFCAKLEAEQSKAPQGLSRFLPSALRPGGRALEPGFREIGGRLALDGPDVFTRDPVNLIRMFRLADRRDLDLHPDVFAAAHRSLDLITPRMRRDPAAAEAFLDVLVRGRQIYRALTLMNDSGVLGRYLPEFGRIVAQMQFNMYHSYTVDEHTLRAVAVLADVTQGRSDAELALSASVMPLVADREALFLAMLLHDTGKGGEEGQSLAGARSARSACERLGLAPERTALVVWLVEQHLTMSDFAQKRDVADSRTVADFVRIVGDPERLRMLLLLTVADIRAVGPSVWNGWKGQLLRELFAAAESVFRGGRAGDAAAHFRSDRRALASLARDRLIAAGAVGDTMLAAWVARMEDAYFVAFSGEEQAVHYALTRRAAKAGGAAAQVQVAGQVNAAEVAVAARDRQGLFADLAQTLADFGANVLSARVYTSLKGEALDVFYIQDAAGHPFGCETPRSLTRLIAALEAAARGEPVRAEARRAGLGRAAAFAVKPFITVDNEASEEATVIEASGRDRLGLLAILARTLADARLSLQSAHVDSYGERAVDVFYVVDADGVKLTNVERLAGLRTALIVALQDERPSLGSSPRLERAGASTGR